jgi:hypothetical protein
MEIARVFSFLTYPGKNREVADVTGAEIPIDEGKLCRMLDGIYAQSETECNIPIMFSSDGEEQENEVRTEIRSILNTRRMDAAAHLANRLQRATGGQSGMALLFVCLGKPADEKIVIARFPADEGIVAEKDEGELTVQFVEQVFLKSSHAYKAVMYKGGEDGDDLWSGHAVDRQINHGAKTVADYWIVDFLKSDFKSTSAQGTKRLAVALRSAISSTNSAEVRHEISMAAQLARNINGRRVMTIGEFCDSLNLSEASKRAVLSAVNPARTLQSRFRFDHAEFARHIAYKSVELDNGAMLSAQVTKFEDCFEEVVSDDDPSVITYSTSGKIVDERLRRSK